MSALAKHNPVDVPSVMLTGSTLLAGPISAADVRIKDLGKCLLPSPVVAHLGESAVMFAGAPEKVLVDDRLSVVGDNINHSGDVQRTDWPAIVPPRQLSACAGQ